MIEFISEKLQAILTGVVLGYVVGLIEVYFRQRNSASKLKQKYVHDKNV